MGCSRDRYFSHAACDIPLQHHPSPPCHSLMQSIAPRRALYRSYSTLTINSHRQASQDARSGFRNRSALPPALQPTVINEDGTKTRRMREHGHDSLPLPPLMDPIALEARTRHRDPKSSPLAKAHLTDFQKQLAVNPYGRQRNECSYDNSDSS